MHNLALQTAKSTLLCLVSTGLLSALAETFLRLAILGMDGRGTPLVFPLALGSGFHPRFLSSSSLVDSFRRTATDSTTTNMEGPSAPSALMSPDSKALASGAGLKEVKSQRTDAAVAA